VVAQIDAWPGMSVSEIEKNVKDGNRPEIPPATRERFKDVKKLIDMIENTWSQNPMERMGFNKIAELLNDECSVMQGTSRNSNSTTVVSQYDENKTNDQSQVLAGVSSLNASRSQTFEYRPAPAYNQEQSVTLLNSGLTSTIPRKIFEEHSVTLWNKD
jgi:hypothetical protein